MTEKNNTGKGHGGKGSAPRKNSDQKAYEDNWEKIFGKNKPSHDAKEVFQTATIVDKKNASD